MPITQKRMIDLLSVAEDWRQTTIEMRQTILREAGLAAQGKTTPEAALQNIELMADPALLMADHVKGEAIIAVERNFYSKTRLGINRRARERQQRRANATPNYEDQNNDE